MSAYALPGSIFPPMGGSSSPEKRTNESTSRPLHHFSDVTKEKVGSIASSPAHDATKEEREGPLATEVGIAVKDAKIDPVKLVQSMSSCQDASNKKKNDVEHNPHKDAIEFELSISFNGRSYSATRTLPRIIALRNELVREVNTRRRQLRNRRMRWRQPAEEDDDDDTTVATVKVDEEEEDWDVFIPEIPDCDTESGTRGRGFAMLQALVRPYCPAIERWLRNVADIVPPNSSPSLSNFLWEPVSGSSESTTQRAGVSRSLSSLECIHEDDCAEEDDDDGDEYLETI